MNIVISSGKGGTGKTFISTNVASVLADGGKNVRYLDCDVEEPNGHLFLKPVVKEEKDVVLMAPSGVDEAKCIKCGKCAEACRYNAIASVNNKLLFFNQLCHVCGGCKVVCPVDAIVEKERKIGVIKHGESGAIGFHYALLETAEGAMSPRLIKEVKKRTGKGINIIDSPPGTACPVVETVKDADLCVLVTDPTPFGINDLKLAVDMARDIGQEPVVVVNRAEYYDDRLKEYCSAAGLEIIGEVPDDRRIAEVYSIGGLAVKELSEYRKVFEKIAEKMIDLAGKKRTVKKMPASESISENRGGLEQYGQYTLPADMKKPEEIVIISGKGGTGKTSIAASFAALAEDIVISDCDVDAADLHLILEPDIVEKGDFSGGVKVEVDQDKCTGCGKCFDVCKFAAIRKDPVGGKERFLIDPISCEGCGVCGLVCEADAINMKPAINGEWFVSNTRFGSMSHAKLGVAEENSGRLVTLVRNKAAVLAGKSGAEGELIDGSPGTGCPVIASLTGADHALIVTEPTVSGLHDMERIIAVVKHFNVPSGVVVNKCDLNASMSDRIEQVAKESGLNFFGAIPYDRKVTEAQVAGLSVVEFCEAGEASKKIKDIWIKVKNMTKKS